MSQVDQKIREMDFYFEDVQKTNKEIEQLMKYAEESTSYNRNLKKK